MPCFKPVPGWRSRTVNPDTGKRSIVFTRREASYSFSEGEYETISRPCGQCRFCRAERCRQWGMRAALESKLYNVNSFITLTYSPEHLPANGCLDYDAPVAFMKRLRKRHGSDIRSYGCAEYGSKGGRPHYHLCLFNFDFEDKKQIRNHGGRDALFESEELRDLWPFGYSSVGSLTFESAAYVAGYCTKKLTGKLDHLYEIYNPLTGEVLQNEQGEYLRRPVERSVSVSRMPGIGRPWYDRFGDYVRRNDFVVINGHKMRPPKYFDSIFEREFPEEFLAVKQSRAEVGKEMREKMDEEDTVNFMRAFELGKPSPKRRLTVMEIVEELNARHFKRGFEDE